jgi:predicted O-methyltransferase YrrM
VRRALRPLAGELRWLVDPTDPLRVHNRHLAAAFATRQPGVVVAQGRLIPTEGHMVKSQARFVVRLMARYTWIVEVLEIGFNAGHSSHLFLASRPEVRVTSFDLGDHEYVDMVKGLIDRRFPGRHELIKGDSRTTVPEFAREHPTRRFDLIYIDGGHDDEVAAADIANCAPLAGPRALVMMDDLEPARDYGVGPTRAWTDAVESGLVEERVLVEDGFPLTEVPVAQVDPDRVVWALGRYRR